MPHDDSFRKHLHHIITALEAWAKEMRPWADIEIDRIDGAWRLSATPRVSTACPFEIVLRSDRRYDIRIGNEVYVDRSLDALTDIPQLVRSIANGRVITRRWESWKTGLLYRVETIVDMPGSEGRFVRENPDAPAVDDVELEAAIEAYAPYRR
ncbi:MAG: hypothetical protein DIU63_12340 [Proteobacteria bacterium]|jgi:hypothetical protein|nr:MAG: hypothetical protein DIU63_12340 [Pseudomonadota bacterium]